MSNYWQEFAFVIAVYLGVSIILIAVILVAVDVAAQVYYKKFPPKEDRSESEE